MKSLRFVGASGIFNHFDYCYLSLGKNKAITAITQKINQFWQNVILAELQHLKAHLHDARYDKSIHFHVCIGAMTN